MEVVEVLLSVFSIMSSSVGGEEERGDIHVPPLNHSRCSLLATILVHMERKFDIFLGPDTTETLAEHGCVFQRHPGAGRF